MLRLISVVLAACSLLLVTDAAMADVSCGGCGSILDARLDALQRTDSWYESSRDELLATNTADWTVEQVNSYLEVALLRIYISTNISLHEGTLGELNPTMLPETSCLVEWPLNPLNEWKPIEIVELSAGYSPGDIAYELCPMSHATKSMRLSYQYYIYGPDQNCTPPTVYGRNAEWADVPAGTAFTLGVIYQTDDEIADTKELLLRIAERIKEQETENQSAGSTQEEE